MATTWQRTVDVIPQDSTVSYHYQLDWDELLTDVGRRITLIIRSIVSGISFVS
jgi:hypothetical protein